MKNTLRLCAVSKDGLLTDVSSALYKITDSTCTSFLSFIEHYTVYIIWCLFTRTALSFPIPIVELH